MALYIRRKYDSLQAKVFLLGFGLLAMIIIGAGIITSNFLLAQFTLLVFLSLSFLLMIYGTWQWIGFLLVFRKAGRIANGTSQINYELNWSIGLIFLGISLLSLDSGRTGVLLFTSCINLIMAILSTQYRQNGILHNGRFIPWGAIATLSWERVRSTEIIYLHLESKEIISIPIHFMRRKNILDFIKLKLPTQFAQANLPNLSGEIASPPSSLPIR